MKLGNGDRKNGDFSMNFVCFERCNGRFGAAFSVLFVERACIGDK